MFLPPDKSQEVGIWLRAFLYGPDDGRAGDNAVHHLSELVRNSQSYVPRLDRDLNEVDQVHLEGFRAGSLEELNDKIESLVFDERKNVSIFEVRWLTALLAARMSRAYPGLCVLSFDAHAGASELSRNDVPDDQTWARWLGEKLGKNTFFQVGGRSYSKDERDWLRYHQRLLPNFEVDLEVAVRTVLHEIGDKPLYVSIDFDVLDPSFAPEVAEPEGFGVSYSELRAALDVLKDAEVVGFDMANLPRMGGAESRTLRLAAEVMRDNLLTWWS